MGTPPLSILMPIYNGERFLKEAIDSLLNQTFRDFEIVIVNDASTDNSLKLVKSYKDKRIRLINHKRNLGFIGALNSGLENIKTKYVACMNQDDISHPKRFEKEFNFLENHLEIFLVGSSAICIDEKGKEICKFRKYNHPNILAWRLRRSNGIIYPSIMFRNKEVFFDRLHEYGLYYRLIKRGEKLTNLQDFLVKYRVHSNALSSYDKENQTKLMKEVIIQFKYLRGGPSILKKIIYSVFVLMHHFRTKREKKRSLFGKENLVQ